VRIYRDIRKFDIKKPVVTIGTFDGVHLGHIKVIESLKKIAKQNDGESVILTFWPHPRHVLAQQNERIPILTTIEERIERFKKAGVDHLIIQPFTVEFSQMSSEQFILDLLVERLKVKHLVIGYDHQFGKDRMGTYDILLKESQEYNFEIHKINKHCIEDISISSTKIRKSIESGDMDYANKYLGYTYSISGKVIKGDMLGRQLGFPTANIQLDHMMKHIPKAGVYAVEVGHFDRKYGGMLNIGYRPTISRNYKSRQIEVNIFDFSDDIYDHNITIYFRKRIRDEIKFDSLEDLKDQLKKDKQVSKEILS
jgi:riboflavin kinase/FMN adenylyltransferase